LFVAFAFFFRDFSPKIACQALKPLNQLKQKHILWLPTIFASNTGDIWE
jgi:hypothetical protein